MSVELPPGPADANPYLPRRRSLPALRAAATTCRGCELHRNATQTVFGEGPPHARLVAVGEIPGEFEDRTGRPFVGPAGRELDAALERAGIERGSVYLTNAVKHFKFRARGKRRIHESPTRGEVKACLPWLHAELALLAPDALVLLGATAGKALLGSAFVLGPARGRPLDSNLARLVIATAHPSSILRTTGEDARRAARAEFVADLCLVARHLGASRGRDGA
jgi:uracil-DNA glycosylase family protein